MQALEFIQRAATCNILNYTDVKYSERCTKLNLLPLSFRRDCADLILFYKAWIVRSTFRLFFRHTHLHDKSLREPLQIASFALSAPKQRRADIPSLTL